MKIGDIVKNLNGKFGLIIKVKNNFHAVEDICHEWKSPKVLLVMLSSGKIEIKHEFAYEII